MNPHRLMIVVVGLVGLLSMSAHTQEATKPKYSVKIRDDKTVVVEMAEDAGAIDPAKRINFSTQGNFFANINTLRGETLHLSHFPMFQINGRTLQPGQGGRFEMVQPLGKAKSGKQRDGFT